MASTSTLEEGRVRATVASWLLRISIVVLLGGVLLGILHLKEIPRPALLELPISVMPPQPEGLAHLQRLHELAHQELVRLEKRQMELAQNLSAKGKQREGERSERAVVSEHIKRLKQEMVALGERLQPSSSPYGQLTDNATSRLEGFRVGGLTSEETTHLRSIKDAKVAFNHPGTIYVARRTQISLALAPTEQNAVARLGETFERGVEGTVRTAAVSAAARMLAKLHGKDFKINAAGPEEKLFVASRPAEWTWYVEPLVAGEAKLLRLELFAILSRGKERLPPLIVRTFEARIDVNVRVWDRVVIYARDAEPVAVVLSSLGVLGTVWALY